MQAADRRTQIWKDLQQQTEATSAQTLARRYAVSRQIIVGDIALLRAEGCHITATPRGYVCETKEGGLVRTIASLHSSDQMEQELQICVDNGCTVLDVIVEHPVYGQLTGLLNISSRYDLQQFLQKVAKESAHALSELTDGIHLHTLSCPDEAAYERVCRQLDEARILLKE